jgi:hypothetical protein
MRTDHQKKQRGRESNSGKAGSKGSSDGFTEAVFVQRPAEKRVFAEAYKANGDT